MSTKAPVKIQRNLARQPQRRVHRAHPIKAQHDDDPLRRVRDQEVRLPTSLTIADSSGNSPVLNFE